MFVFFFSSRRRHTRYIGDWSSDVCSSDLHGTNRAPIFSVWDTNSTSTNLIPLGPKIVPARFGPPWAGQPYQLVIPRSEERRVGKEWRSGWWPENYKKKKTNWRHMTQDFSA